METTAKRLENNIVEVTVTVDAKSVDEAVAKMYKDLAKQNKFPGFRPGRAPRPVIDNNLGKANVLGETTQRLVESLVPEILEAEDIVPIGDPRFQTPQSVVEGCDYTFGVAWMVRPALELDSYEPVAITLPSDEATEEEIDQQVETFRGYFGKFEDIEGRAIEAGDSVYLKCKGDENAPSVDFENRLYKLGQGSMPASFDEGLMGMKPGDQKFITIELPTPAPAEGEEAPEPKTAVMDVTVNRLVTRILPDITDEFVKNNFGFEDIATMRAGIAEEIGRQKKQAIPQIKENRVTGKLAARLQGEATPMYVNTIFQELGQNFLMQLQSRGMDLDNYLMMNNIDSETFMSDLQKQATDIANESLALDALVAKMGFDCTEDEVDEEFKKATPDNWEETKAQFAEDGRLPAVRVSIRRNKAIEWLLETADVTISDKPEEAPAEAAEEAPAEEEKPKKKATRRKKAEEAPAEAAEEAPAEEEKPKKKATRRKKAEEEAPAEAAE